MSEESKENNVSLTSKKQNELLRKLKLPQRPIPLLLVVSIYSVIAYYLWPVLLCILTIWFVNKKVPVKKNKVILITSLVVLALIASSFWFIRLNNNYKVAKQKNEAERIVREAQEKENKKKREEEAKVKSQKDQEEKAKIAEETKDLDTKVTYNTVAFKIDNNEDKNWVNCIFRMNNKYEYRTNGIPKKDSVIVPFIEFATGDGTRFNVYQTKIQDLAVLCANEGSTILRSNTFMIN